MQRKRNTNSISVNDTVAAALCLIGMAVSFTLFWNDLNLSFSKQNEQPIAFIYFKYNTAQRRLANRNIWERLQTASPIYNGDRIRTAEASEAYTVFNDGSRIDIHENTLIQVFAAKGSNSAQFIDGAISVNTAPEKSDFFIVSGSTSVTFGGDTEASFVSQTGGTVAATVTAGTISIAETAPAKTPQPKVLTLFSGSGSLFDSITGTGEATAPAVMSKLPADALSVQNITAGSTYVFTPAAATAADISASAASKAPAAPQPAADQTGMTLYLPTTTYSITHQADKVPYLPVNWDSSVALLLQFSRKPDFSQITAARVLPADSSSTVMPLDFAEAEDTLFWRAVPEDPRALKGSCPSGIIFIRVPQEQTMNTIAVNTFGKDAKNFSESMQTPLQKSAPAAEPAALIPQTDTAAKTEQQAAAAASPDAKASAVLHAAPAEPPEPAEPALVKMTPQPVEPAAGRIFTDADFAGDTPQIAFSWKDVKGAQSYTFELYAGTGKVLAKTVKQPSYVLAGDDLSFLENGTFTWNVTASQKSAGQTWQSQTGSASFIIRLSSISNAQVDKSYLLNAQ